MCFYADNVSNLGIIESAAPDAPESSVFSLGIKLDGNQIKN